MRPKIPATLVSRHLDPINPEPSSAGRPSQPKRESIKMYGSRGPGPFPNEQTFDQRAYERAAQQQANPSKTIDMPPEDIKDLSVDKSPNFIKEQVDQIKQSTSAATLDEAHSKIDKVHEMLLEITENIGPAFKEVKDHFGEIKGHFAGVDSMFVLHRRQMDDLQHRMGHLENKMKKFLAKHDTKPTKTKPTKQLPITGAEQNDE